MIGGYAVNYYGYSRSTGDIDIWVRADMENSVRVSAALRDYANRRVSDVDGLSVPFLGLNDLKRNKLATGRAKDLADLDELGRRYSYRRA